jgi:ubiquinone/menaquinone biosynthesis C-methylase UbiE
VPTPEELKEQQRERWSSVAPAWERHHVWFEQQSRPLTEWMCSAVALRSGLQVLDIACGSGQPAISLAKGVGERGKVIATDISKEMVDVTRRMAEKAELDNLEARVMDAEHLELHEGSFDAVTCRFGLMFCPDPVAAVSEVHRVLRVGGRFAFAVWDEPSKNPFSTVVSTLLRQLDLASPLDPETPGIFRLAPPGVLDSVLKQAGFTSYEIESRPMIWDYGTPEDYWLNRSELAADLKAAIARLGADDVRSLHDAVIEAVQPYVENGCVRVTATPLCASGRR